MKHQTEQNMRSLVYQYGTVPSRIAPVQGEDEAIAQLKLARRLWNVLVAIDRVRMDRYRQIMRDEVQEKIDELRAAKAALLTERKARHQKVRAKAATPEINEELKRIAAALKMLVEHQKSTSGARHAARRPQLENLNRRSNARNKRARQAAASMGLYWGTYNAVMQSADSGRKLGQLQFRGFRGEGTLTAQIQGGMSVAESMTTGDSQFQIDEPVAGRKWRYARIRIASRTDRGPVWLAIPIVYHRDIDPESRIKSVSATRRLVAGKVRWYLNVTVTLPQVTMKPVGHAVAVDIGWRLLPEGVRVGYWQDERGKHGQLLVAKSDTEQLKKVADLRSITDTARDEFLPTLVAFLAAAECGQEWRERSAHLAQWRSSDRLAALIRWWSDHRLPHDEEMHQAAVEWRQHYLHLANWWRNQQDQMVLRIREQYRIFGKWMADTYSIVILEKFDLRKVAEKPDKPEDRQPRTAESTYRQMVSPSVFRSALVNACRREGVEVRMVPAEYTTSKCHACGIVDTWDQAASVMRRCTHCSTLWDQDHNAAINLLASGQALATENQGDAAGIPPVPEDRSQSTSQQPVESIG